VVADAAGTRADATDLPPTISVEYAAKLLGVSRSAAYRAAARGQLPTIAFGRRLLVPTSRLLEMLGLSVEEGR
jgi:excisionase family DNA binding protein